MPSPTATVCLVKVCADVALLGGSQGRRLQPETGRRRVSCPWPLTAIWCWASGGLGQGMTNQ